LPRRGIILCRGDGHYLREAVGVGGVVVANTTSLAAARVSSAELDDAVGAAAVDSVVESAVVDTAVDGLELLVAVACGGWG